MNDREFQIGDLVVLTKPAEKDWTNKGYVDAYKIIYEEQLIVLVGDIVQGKHKVICPHHLLDIHPYLYIEVDRLKLVYELD